MQQRLTRSLHRIASQRLLYIKPEAEEDPNQVDAPWECDVKVGQQPIERLTRARVADLYQRRDINGRLLILGDPGTGKTTALLKLAEALVDRAQVGNPIPVLLNLSTWKQDDWDLEPWLAAELKVKYGVRADIGKQWVSDDKKIIPLLDGLDELAGDRQERCVERINQFLQPGRWSGSLVVCSRTKEYQRYATRLGLNGSLTLQPWSAPTIHEYALRVADGPQLWHSIEADPLLLQGDPDDPDAIGLAQIPLLLNILALAYQSISFHQWQLAGLASRTPSLSIRYLQPSHVGTQVQR